MDSFHILQIGSAPESNEVITNLEQPRFVVESCSHADDWMKLVTDVTAHFVLLHTENEQHDLQVSINAIRGQHVAHYTYIIVIQSADEDSALALHAGADDVIVASDCPDELIARLESGVRILTRESNLQKLAATDSLSGLATKRSLFDHAEREWSRASRYHVPLSCVMLDIDYFKRINDNYGHAVGDEAIRIVAQVLTANSRSSDVVGRYGGEEFCIILPETTEADAAFWSERVRRALRANREISGHEIALAASFGVAQRLADTQSPAELIELADQALLVAKRSGRDQVLRYQTINQSAALTTETDGLGELFRDIKAKQVMTNVVAGLNKNETVGRAVQFLLRFQIHSAPVINDDGRLVGMIAERDVLSIMLWPSWWSQKTKEVMKGNVVCYDEETSVMSIYDFLSRVSLRAVVITKDHKPTGIISQSGLLRWLTNSLAVGALPLPRHEIDDFTPDRPESLTEVTGGQNQLVLTARKLAREVSRLESRLDNDDEMIPTVVGGATRIQELTNDLLAFTRHQVDPSGFPEGSLEVSP